VTPSKQAAPPPPGESGPEKPKQTAEKPAEYPAPDVDEDNFWEDEGLPPPPEAFPVEWEEILEPAAPVPVEANSNLISTASSEDGEQIEETETSPVPEERAQESEAEAPPRETESAVISGDAPPQPTAVPEAKATPVIKAELPEKIIAPIIPPMPTAEGQDVHMITVILRPRVDKVRDNLLLRRVFGLMISFPGNDRFAFHIFEKGRGHLLEFPNLTTGYTPELAARLHELVGAENVRVETITFQ
jgi:hypothetical protein